MKIDYDKVARGLAKVGIAPGQLLRLKKGKYFWKEGQAPEVIPLESENGMYKDWLRGEKFVEVPQGAILMYLGLLKREVRKDATQQTIMDEQHRFVSFIYKQEVIWWDFASIEDSSVFLEKFEVIDCEKTAEKIVSC